MQTEVMLNVKDFKGVKKGFFYNIKKYRFIYLLMLPGILFFLIFCYIPMYGVIIAFQDFQPFWGIKNMFINPVWVGFKHFSDFFNSYYFVRILSNTLMISTYKLLFGFPAPIILALLLNEVKHLRFKKIVQTISYLPNFLSWVIIMGMLSSLLSSQTGFINYLIGLLGIEPINFLGDNRYFRSVIVSSSIWAGVGMSSIIYLAALSGVNPELYECAEIEGANRFQKIWFISLPSISSIVTIVLIFSLGGILDAGFEQIVLTYSPLVYAKGDIIDTYVYREGLLGARYSYAAAIGLFKNVIGMIFIISTNFIVKKLGKEALW